MLVRALLVAACVVLGYAVVSYLAQVLAPILTALGIAYLLNPVLERLVARGASRSIGAAILLGGTVVIVVGAIVVLAPRAGEQVSSFVRDLPTMFNNLSAWTDKHLGLEMPSDWKAYVNDPHLQDALDDSSGPLRTLAAAAVGGVFNVLAVMAELLLVPVFSFYFMVDWPNILRRLDHVVPPRSRGAVREAVREIDRVVAGWVRGQAIVTSILAVLYAAGFTIVGMPLSLPMGLLVGCLTVIPFVGTFVGAAISAIVTLAAGGSVETLGMVGGVFLVLHLLEAGVLTPKIVGHRVGLSESGALLAVVAGGKLLGFVGVVLAVPIAATVAVLVRYAVKYYEHTSFYGHESDADVVITPAMALIMPGVRLGAKIIAETAEPVVEGPVVHHEEGTGVPHDPMAGAIPTEVDDDWSLAPDAMSTIALGPSGAPRPVELEPDGDATPEPADPDPRV